MSWGIYVHFPYCSHLCSYCDFNVFTPSHIPQQNYTDALIRELRVRCRPKDEPASSLYIGGGTPSLWEPSELHRFLAALHEVCDLEAQAEVTLEANPQDITAEGLIELRKLGINRLSVGMQSLHQAELDAVDRRQRVDDAKTALEAVRSAGFESFSLDFMFGLPGQTLRGWIDDLGEIVSFGAPHLSIYALTVEPKTALERRISEGKVRVASDDLSASMLFAARELLTEAGYLHYEVSSYAKPGFRARHNSAYWRMQPYWGLGAGAHGFDGERRWVNTRQHKRYMEATSVQQFEMTSELLSSGTLAFERVITGLRDLENGVDLGDDHHHYREAIELEVKRGRLVSDGRSIRLTDQGLRFMNDVLLSFA